MCFGGARHTHITLCFRPFLLLLLCCTLCVRVFVCATFSIYRQALDAQAKMYEDKIATLELRHRKELLKARQVVAASTTIANDAPATLSQQLKLEASRCVSSFRFLLLCMSGSKSTSNSWVVF